MTKWLVAVILLLCLTFGLEVCHFIDNLKIDEVVKSCHSRRACPRLVGDRESFFKTRNDSEQVGMTEKCFFKIFYDFSKK